MKKSMSAKKIANLDSIYNYILFHNTYNTGSLNLGPSVQLLSPQIFYRINVIIFCNISEQDQSRTIVVVLELDVGMPKTYTMEIALSIYSMCSSTFLSWCSSEVSFENLSLRRGLKVPTASLPRTIRSWVHVDV